MPRALALLLALLSLTTSASCEPAPGPPVIRNYSTREPEGQFLMKVGDSMA
jgi:hypothetical protein